MDLVRAVADLGESTDLHLARILILLDAFSSENAGGMIEGLTKLAKLDFLLRYPVLLERALQAKGRSSRAVALEDYERYSVESQMVRYRFGPWDHRYHSLLNILVARGLVTVSIEGRKVMVAATGLGRESAKRLAADSQFEKYVARAKLLKTHFDLKGSSLMRFIYDTFPEVVSLRSNTPISV